MKKLLLLLLLFPSLLLYSQAKGSLVRTNSQCLSATTEDNFSELNKVCNRKDEASLKQMISAGKVYVLSKNTKATIIESGLAKKKITTVSGLTVWVSSEFLSASK